jgi:hypothetical protein
VLLARAAAGSGQADLFDARRAAGGHSDGPGRTRRDGNQGANPALALIAVPQQGRRLDATPP